jgi:bifunctional DNA-binding transcriptional regulator/antitoxin component of YhaV-PrlF toxin-antitoxin module
MSQEKETGVIGTATLLLGDGIVRGIIPAMVLSTLKAKAGDKLAFELQTKGSVLVRKSTAAERKAGRLTDSQDNEGGVIALAAISPHQEKLRGRIPAPVSNALKAKSGEVLAFERTTDGSVLLRKSTAGERKAKKKGGKS